MFLIVTGSIGIDTVKTPFGVREKCLGGSAVYFSMAASFFGPVRFVGVVGKDCAYNLAEVFAGRNVDLRGLEVRDGSKTFVWHGTYQENMNERTTDYVELNVLAEAPPKVPDVFKDSEFVFLANTAPALQLELLEQITKPVFVTADTMNLWINENLEDLKKLLQKIDCLIINDDEARLLACESNLIKAAEKILEMGMNVVVIKKGQSGSLMCNEDGEKFLLPAYPAVDVIDPTGAGDSFAGGMLGYISAKGRTDFETLKTALAFGTVVASFTISDFSLQGLQRINKSNIELRIKELAKITRFNAD